ncbi:MAG: HNH endonuclease [Clostridiales bacterium]|nr:HNH endonuclease [Clostridiales bacterium]
MSRHRYDTDITELETYFNSVIDWVSGVFIDVDDSMRGLPWGALYEQYHRNAYDPQEVSEKVHELLEDDYVKDNKGIYEYILGGCEDTKLLNVRIFDDVTKKSVYLRQTKEANEKNISNCPLSALGNDSNKNRIYKLNEMDADHVSAWSRGGATDISNCQMLCKTHNRAKGNK